MLLLEEKVHIEGIMNIKFSVLMSVYKNEKPAYFKQALESVVTQTLMPNEIVIVKDGPLTQELDEVLDDYQKKYPLLFKIVAFEKNRGLGLALHDGVLTCKYEYIARMDTDDICKPERFEKQIKYLKENPNVALLGCFSEEFDTNVEKPYALMKLPYIHKEIVGFASKRNPFRHPTVVFKKDAVLKIGNYRDFKYFEDYDLFVRIILHGYEVANLDEFLVCVRADKDQFARRGGLLYLRYDLKFQKFLYCSKFVNLFQFMENVVVRSVVRLLPNCIRIWVYKSLLRK